MRAEIDFGKGNILTVGYTFRTKAKIENAAARVAKVMGHGPQPAEWVIGNAANFAELLMIVVDAVLTDGGNKTGDGKKGTVDVAELLEQYTQEVGDIGDLISQIMDMNTKLTKPRTIKPISDGSGNVAE